MDSPVMDQNERADGVLVPPLSRRGSDADPVDVPLRVSDAERSVEGIVRLMAERELPAPRGGLLVWAWICAVPILAATIAFGLLTGALNLPGALYIGLFVLSGRLISRLSLDASHRHAALLLPELDGAWMGPLIDALVYPSPSLRSVARLRLTTVLPVAGDEAHQSLTAAQRALLFDQLTPNEATRQPEFVSSILRFGERMGDELALEGATRLAHLIASNARQRKVVRAARHALPGLEARVAGRAAIEVHSGESTGASRSDGPAADLSPQARALLDQAEDDANRTPGMRFAFLVAVWGIVLPYGLWQTVAGFARGDWLAGCLFASGTALVSQAHRLTLTPQQARIGAHLATVDDIHVVGPLAEMLSWPDNRIYASAIAALTRLLPRLKSSDTQLLNARHRALLYQMLRLPNARRHAEFMVSLLQALEQVGDTAAIPFVLELAHSKPSSLREQRVVDAAARCLPFLEECAQQNQNSQILLRATCSDADESLLRPAGQTPGAAPELLVRVAQAAEDAG